MKYTVLLQKEKDGYSVTVPGLPQCQSSGSTEEEALDRIRSEITDMLRHTKAVEVDVSSPNGLSHPWQAFAGIWENDSSFDHFLKEIKTERCQDGWKKNLLYSMNDSKHEKRLA